MKRAIALILCLMLLGAAALADQDLLLGPEGQYFDIVRVLGRSCYVTGSGKDQAVRVYYELQNTGVNPIKMDGNRTSITFLDAAGQSIYQTTDLTLCYPGIVYPGQRFFLVQWVFKEYTPEAFPAVTQAADYSLYLAFDQTYDYDYEKFAPVFLPCQYEVRKKQSGIFDKLFGGKGDHTYEFEVTVTNDTGEAISDPMGTRFQIVLILRDENGSPIFVDSESGDFTSPALRELAAGESKRFTVSPTSRDVFDFFKEYDFTASDAEVWVMYHKPYS